MAIDLLVLINEGMPKEPCIAHEGPYVTAKETADTRVPTHAHLLVLFNEGALGFSVIPIEALRTQPTTCF